MLTLMKTATVNINITQFVHHNHIMYEKCFVQVKSDLGYNFLIFYCL